MISALAPSPEAEASELDREIGARLRHIRNVRRLTQEDIGKVVGVSFQQIQKYERGTNRISSSTLILLARALDVSPGELLGVAGARTPAIDWDLLSEDGHAFLQAVSEIGDAEKRRIVLELARQLAGRAGD